MLKKSDETRLIGDEMKTLREWDLGWLRVQGGLVQPHPKLRWKVGLYRLSMAGRVMALGKGVDKSGGMAKRLADFIRPGWSGRDHYAGAMIFDHRHELDLDLLVFVQSPSARELGEALKPPMMRLHEPVWNAKNAPYQRK